MNFDLQDRVFVVTGAAGRLGTAITAALLKDGAHVIAIGRRQESLDSLISNMSELHRKKLATISLDLTCPADRSKILARVESDFGAIHGLVNNAYAGVVGTFDKIDESDFMKASQLNMIVPFELTKLLLPAMEAGADQSGCFSAIVNVSSMYGLVSPDPDNYKDSGANNPVHYGATKAGMLQMTRYMAVHLSRHKVRVNSVAPGPFPDVSAEPPFDGFFEGLANKVPLGRVGDPSEISGPVLFLLSNSSSFVSGETLAVDGGWTAW